MEFSAAPVAGDYSPDGDSCWRILAHPEESTLDRRGWVGDSVLKIESPARDGDTDWTAVDLGPKVQIC
jgi:hypothetical protein